MRVLRWMGIGACSAAFLLEDNEKLSPAQRIVKLLQEMKTQLEEEASKDEEIAEKLECWCKTNRAEKEKAIKDGDARTDELVSVIEENSAKKAKMDVTIKQAKKEIAELRDSLEQAIQIRTKEQSAYRDEEVELVKTITNLENAIQVLSRHNAGLLQLSPELVQGIQTVLHSAAEKHVSMFGKSTYDTSVSFLQTGVNAVFMQAVQGDFAPALSEKYGSQIVASFAQGPAHQQKYNNQSGQIFGILTSMLDNFKVNLTDSQKTEAGAQKAFAELKATANEQISATSKALANAKSEFADASRTLSDAKEELEETRNVRAADVEFLRNLNGQCQDIDHQWEQRQKERAAETAAISDAIAILTDDDNRELMAKTVTFTQTGSSRRARAAALLKAASKAAPSWDDLSYQWAGEKKPAPKQQLAALSVSAQLDAFTKVKQAMDDMIAEIKSQMTEDVKHRDFCNDEFKKNDRDNVAATHQKEDLETKIDDLASQIEALKADIAAANQQIKETQTSIKQAGEDREAENQLFQTTVNEQRATQVVLKKALDRLNEYYGKKAALLQTSQTPPVQFEPYRKNSGSSPVLSLLDKVMEDSKAIEEEAVKDEGDAQANYERFVADSNSTIKQLQNEITTKTENKAAKQGDKVTAESGLQSTIQTLDNLANYRASLHGSCDFVQKNFEVRQHAMTEEIEAIQQAKAIISGAK